MLHELIFHMIEDYAVNRVKQTICFSPFLTIEQKSSFCNALDFYSNMKKLNFCLKLMQNKTY